MLNPRKHFTLLLFLSFFAASRTQAESPAREFSLSTWRLTLPVNTDAPGNPDEIRQPEFAVYSHSKYFFVNREKKGVVFRAPCGGATTKGSRYPRCELRETKADGSTLADWNTDDDSVHAMELVASIEQTPVVKKHVVCAQIHDANDDLLMVRLEGKKLFVERNTIGDVSLDKNYQLGTPFSLKIQSTKGSIRVWYNEDLKMDWKTARQGCYFKAGCYTQSNVAKGDSADAYGEVVIYKIRVEHKGISKP